MTPQEIFNTVSIHLINQKQCSRDINVCLYRGPNGLKCAVGCLIPDDMYDSKMEGKTIFTILVEFKLPSYFKENIKLMSNLQNVHDSCIEHETTDYFDMSDLKDRLFAVADYYNFNTTVLNEIPGDDCEG